MVFQKLQNSYFSHKISILLYVLFCSLFAKASNTEPKATMTIDDSFIKDITYDYQLISRGEGYIDCCGTLNISVAMPTDVEVFFVERTRPHLSENDKIYFGSKSVWPNMTTDINLDKIYWGSFFRIRVRFNDEREIFSPTYSINDFISEQDMDLLRAQSSVENMDSDNINLRIENKNLYIETHENISLSIFDLSGKNIYTGNIYHSSTIYLNHASSPFIIVTYKNSSTTVTKKLFVK